MRERGAGWGVRGTRHSSSRRPSSTRQREAGAGTDGTQPGTETGAAGPGPVPCSQAGCRRAEELACGASPEPAPPPSADLAARRLTARCAVCPSSSPAGQVGHGVTANQGLEPLDCANPLSYLQHPQDLWDAGRGGCWLWLTPWLITLGTGRCSQ